MKMDSRVLCLVTFRYYSAVTFNSSHVSRSVADDAKSRRRRRRFFPPDVLQQTASYSSCSNEDRLKSDTSYTAYNFSPLSSPITATTAAATATRTSPKRSQLSVHMENARRSVISSVSDVGKITRTSPKSSISSSPKVRSFGYIIFF